MILVKTGKYWGSVSLSMQVIQYFQREVLDSGASCLCRDSVAEITGNHGIDGEDTGVAEEEAQLGADVLAGGGHGSGLVRDSLLPDGVSRGDG